MFHGFRCTETASQNSSPESASMVAMLKVPGITLISLSLMGVAATWIILDPILEPHLEEQVTFCTTNQSMVMKKSREREG